MFGLSAGAVTWRKDGFVAMEENVLVGFEQLDRRLVSLFEALRHKKSIEAPVVLEYDRGREPERPRVVTDRAEIRAWFAANA